MNLQGLPEVLVSERAAKKRKKKERNVDKYFDSRPCFQPAYQASASRACLLLPKDGPCSSSGCAAHTAELSQERRVSATGRKEGCWVREEDSRSEASEPFWGHWTCLTLSRTVCGTWRLNWWKNSKYLRNTWQEYFSFRDQCCGWFLQEEEPASEHLVLENTKQREKARSRLCFRCAHITPKGRIWGGLRLRSTGSCGSCSPLACVEDEWNGLTLMFTPCLRGSHWQFWQVFDLDDMV